MSCITGTWISVVVMFAFRSGLSISLQPLVLQGWNTEKACVDWNLVGCVGMGGGGGRMWQLECHTQHKHKCMACMQR